MIRVTVTRALFLGGVLLTATTSALPLLADQPSQSAWQSDPALATQLDVQTAIGSFGTIQPPKGYTLQEKDSSDGAGSVYQWTGPAGIKGYTPTLDVIIAIAPKNSGEQYTTDQIMASLVSTFHAGKSNWKLSSVSVGTADGHVFHRVDWNGLDQSKKLNLQGSVFGTQLQNGTFLLVSAEDAEPDSKTLLPILVASALTFNIKNA